MAPSELQTALEALPSNIYQKHTSNIYQNIPTNSFLCYNNVDIRSNNVVYPSLVHKAITVPAPSQPEHIQETLRLLQATGFYTPERVRDILNCQMGKALTFVCTNCHNVVELTLKKCNSRLCPFCQATRRKRVYHQLADIFKTYQRLRFLTLGFANVPTLSKGYFLRCQGQFRALKRELQKRGYHFGTYVNVLEVKFHARGEPITSRKSGEVLGEYLRDEWNVHYHVLFDGDYIPQGILSDLLLKVTGGESFYTYIKAPNNDTIHSSGAALHYVLKYLGKVQVNSYTPSVLATFYQATEKVRFYNISLTRQDKTHKPPPYRLTCANCQQQVFRLAPKDEYDFALVEYDASTLPVQGSFYSPGLPSEPLEPLVGARAISSIEEELVTGVTTWYATPDAAIKAYLTERPKDAIVPFETFQHELGFDESALDAALQALKRNGEIYEPRAGRYGLL